MAQTFKTSEKPGTETRRGILRFPLVYRLEHWIQFAAFTTLAITGLIQKGAGAAESSTSGLAEFAANLSKGLISLLGGIESVRIIHRIGAITLMLVVVYHLGAIFYRLYVMRYRPTMVPTFLDARNAWQTLLYNLKLSKKPPQQGRYTFEEKMEYWALVWGNIIMILTGFMLWNPLATTRILPGEAIPAAKAAHGNEALLAVLAIILWHMYHVLVRTFNKSMFTGYLSEGQMEEDHPLELADIKAGTEHRPLDPKAVERRKKVFFPVYGVVGLLLLVGIYAFVTFEQTAVAERPAAENVEIFAPLPPTPTPTPPPTATPAPLPEAGSAPMTWEGGIGAIFEKCTTCHGDTALGGLNLSNYNSALAGGNSGPGVVPGNPDASEIVIIQSAGGHPLQLSPEELDIVRQWIAAGAEN